MAVGIIIHIAIGTEKRTEFFSDQRIRIGSDEFSDLQIHTKEISAPGLWFELEISDGAYRIVNFDENLKLQINGKPLNRYAAIADGDTISIENTAISFAFFSLESKSSLITTNREQPHIAQFIEAAALGSATSPKRDEAKMFLREFVRELVARSHLGDKINRFGAGSRIYYRHFVSRCGGQQ